MGTFFTNVSGIGKVASPIGDLRNLEVAQLGAIEAGRACLGGSAGAEKRSAVEAVASGSVVLAVAAAAPVSTARRVNSFYEQPPCFPCCSEWAYFSTVRMPAPPPGTLILPTT